MSSFTNRAVALFDGMNLYNHAKMLSAIATGATTR